MKRDKWKKHISKKQALLTPVPVEKKGGYPRGTRPGDGGLAESRSSIPTYTFEEAVEKLKRGYKMEVVFEPKIRKTQTNIISGNSIIARLTAEVRQRIIDGIPLKVVKTELRRAVWAYDYAAPTNESVETAVWDMPFAKQIMGYNPMQVHLEDEEEVMDDESKEKLATKIADEILSLRKNPKDKDKKEKVEEIVDEISDKEEKDLDKAGLIRYVKGAHLVYKRQSEDGSYEELWIYPISKDNSGHKIKKAIIAGTDIDVDSEQSPDGKQSCELWTAGNAQMIKILGLPN